jgi:hypothetical protein
MEHRRQKVWQAAGCLLVQSSRFRFVSDLEGTEFSGGSITGPLLRMQDVGSNLFFIVLPLTFFLRRIAAAVILLASLLCLPPYLLSTAPGPLPPSLQR